jgi:hypothetical protein
MKRDFTITDVNFECLYVTFKEDNQSFGFCHILDGDLQPGHVMPQLPDWLVPGARLIWNVIPGKPEPLTVDKLKYPVNGSFAPILIRVWFTDGCWLTLEEVLRECKPAPQLPDWVKVGQWLLFDNTTYYHVESIDLDESEHQIQLTDGQFENAEYFTNEDTYYKPISIRPWTLDEAKAEMKKGTQVLSDGDTYNIFRVAEDKDGTVLLYMKPAIPKAKFTFWQARAEQIARDNETTKHQPCGTPVRQD